MVRSLENGAAWRTCSPQLLDLGGKPVVLGPHGLVLGFHHDDPFAQRGPPRPAP